LYCHKHIYPGISYNLEEQKDLTKCHLYET
jgi:hypothetical protein